VSRSGFHDRIVVQEVIKEIAQSPPIETSQQARSFKGFLPLVVVVLPLPAEGFDFLVVVLNEVDKLTTEAQAGLRRTMEKYMRTCRLILVCNSITKVLLKPIAEYFGPLSRSPPPLASGDSCRTKPMSLRSCGRSHCA